MGLTPTSKQVSQLGRAATIAILIVVLCVINSGESYAQRIHSSGCRDAYRTWQQLPPVSAFSLSRNGRNCAYSQGYRTEAEAARAANEGCSKVGEQCRVIASNAGTQEGWILFRDGKFRQAEDEFRKLINDKQNALITTDATVGLGASLIEQGRYEEGVSVLSNMESRSKIPLYKQKEYSIFVRNKSLLAWSLWRHAELSKISPNNKKALINKSVGIYEELLKWSASVLGRTHNTTAQIESELGRAYTSAGRIGEGSRRLQSAYNIQSANLGGNAKDTIDTTHRIGVNRLVDGDLSSSIAFLQIAFAWRNKNLGRHHSHTIWTGHKLAIALSAEGDFDTSADIRNDILDDIHLYYQEVNSSSSVNERVVHYSFLKSYFFDVSRSTRAVTNQARRSFEAQGWWTYGKLDVALSDLGTRLAAKDDELVSVVRQFQETRDRLSGFRNAYAKSFENRENGEALRGSLSGQIERAGKEFDALKGRIERDFPEFAELTLPRSLTAEEAQELLGPGEGLVAYAATNDKLYAWLVTQDRVAWKPVSVTKARLEDLVGALSAGMDLTRTASDAQVRENCAVASTVAGMEDRNFDACKAKELYDLVLGAFDLSGLDKLIVVPDGPLETIPFSMLVTGFDIAGEPDWLIEDHAISTLPTTSSLRALRQAGTPTEEDGRKPYLGIAPVTFDDRDASSPLRGALADLPGTENEVRFLSSLLGSGRDGYVTGNRASEAYVKSAPLKDYRVLSFATHGLMSRQTRDLTEDRISEPALVLASSDEGEDGLLTASEAATLRLDADWVLLSGCNTASGGSEDAEGLSGLARAFFFAGARSLLVSHWSIDDNAAMDVMVETMKRSTSHSKLGKAQALRQAMLTVMNKPGYEHPFFWAPFSLVGVDSSHDQAKSEAKWNGEVTLTTDDGRDIKVDAIKD